MDYADGSLVTNNLWGERWSKLVTNAMGNGLSACTGMISLRSAAGRHVAAVVVRGSGRGGDPRGTGVGVFARGGPASGIRK